LSTAHNCGKYNIWLNGGMIKVSKPPRKVKQKKSGGGLRGKIGGFSYSSRRRLMRTLGAIDKRADLPLFVTLTYPKEFPTDGKIWKLHLKKFVERFRYHFPEACGIWKLEPQKRGAPHYHMLVWGAARMDVLLWVSQAWYEIVGSGDEKHLLAGTQVQKVRSWRGVMSYASKYFGKTFQVTGWDNPGRFWGVFHRDLLPWSEVYETDLTYRKAVEIMRCLRRYAHIKGRDYQSLTVLCNDPIRFCALLE